MTHQFKYCIQLYIIIVFSYFNGNIYAQPKITIIGKNEFTFGQIYEGSKPVHKLKILNAGTTPLIISNISAQCNCSRFHLSSNKVAPRKTAILTVTFISDGYKGNVGKSLSISSNDPSHQVLVIRFTAMVMPVLEVDPRLLKFKNSECLAGEAKTLMIRNTAEKKLKILSIIDSSFVTHFNYSKTILRKGETQTVMVYANPVGEQPKFGEIQIKTDSKRQPRISVRYIIEGSKLQK